MFATRSRAKSLTFASLSVQSAGGKGGSGGSEGNGLVIGARSGHRGAEAKVELEAAAAVAEAESAIVCSQN